MPTLYLVATPIGNLEDITLRALRVLKECTLIAAEDTRKTQRLTARYDIHTPLTSYYEHNKLGKLDAILAALDRGDVAVVSEAGMPGISDPGYELVRAAVERGITVVPLPGASAPVAALTASGLPTDRFLYLGFLPRRAGERRRALTELRTFPHTMIAFEAPHRLADALADIGAILGPARRVAWRGSSPSCTRRSCGARRWRWASVSGRRRRAARLPWSSPALPTSRRKRPAAALPAPT